MGIQNLPVFRYVKDDVNIHYFTAKVKGLKCIFIKNPAVEAVSLNCGYLFKRLLPRLGLDENRVHGDTDAFVESFTGREGDDP